MNLIKKQIFLILVSVFAFAATVAAQPVIELSFQGILTDGEGQEISNEHFDLTVKLLTAEPGRTVLWSQASRAKTDEHGWFGFTVPDISGYLMEGGSVKEPVVISLEMFPNQHTCWIKEPQDFMVSYTLTPELKDNALHLKMSRMEGSELEMHLEDHLYAFKDEYPFAYLMGGFLLSDAPPIDQNSVGDLRQWIVPDPTDSGAATRGVKGGFPKGGYRKKN